MQDCLQKSSLQEQSRNGKGLIKNSIPEGTGVFSPQRISNKTDNRL